MPELQALDTPDIDDQRICLSLEMQQLISISEAEVINNLINLLINQTLSRINDHIYLHFQVTVHRDPRSHYWGFGLENLLCTMIIIGLLGCQWKNCCASCSSS